MRLVKRQRCRVAAVLAYCGCLGAFGVSGYKWQFILIAAFLVSPKFKFIFMSKCYMPTLYFFLDDCDLLILNPYN